MSSIIPIDGLRREDFLTLEGINVAEALGTVAAEGSFLPPLSPGEIKIYGGVDNKQQEQLWRLIDHGTRVVDAIVFLTAKAATTWEQKKAMFAIHDTANPDTSVEKVPKSKVSHYFNSTMLIWLAQGQPPLANSTNPIPQFVRNTCGISDDKRMGYFATLVASFDMRLMNWTWFVNNYLPNKYDPIMLQRIKLTMAGNKPIKLIKTLWTDLENALPNKQAPEYVLLHMLKLKADLGFTYFPLHPGVKSVQNMGSDYSKFYLQSLLLVFDTLGKDDTAVKKMKATGMFKNEKMLEKDAEGNYPLDAHTRLYKAWNISQLSTVMGNPWRVIQNS